MQTLIIHTEDSKLKALKTILKAFEVKFEVKKESPYNPAFVAKIKESEEDFKAGRYKTIKTADLWK